VVVAHGVTARCRQRHPNGLFHDLRAATKCLVRHVIGSKLFVADKRKAALEMIKRHSPGLARRLALGAGKGYDSVDFIAALRGMVVTPHVAQKARHSAIDGRTTHHPGYAASQKRRKKIEEPFGWAKTVGGMAQTVHRGLDRVRAQFTMTMAACNLARLPKLLAA